MIDRAAMERDLTKWSDLYQWFGNDQSHAIDKVLLNDAIKLAERHGLTEKKAVLSKAERKFLEDLERGKIDGYSYEYRKLLKHRILKKHKALTDEALLISKLYDRLQEL